MTEAILLRLSRTPGDRDYGNEAWNPDEPLDLFRAKIPDFDGRIRDADVLDFGCGTGHQTVALAKAGVRSVVGIDINDEHFADARKRAAEAGVGDLVTYTSSPSELADREFDLVLSQNAMEHFDDPASVLRQMKGSLRDGGRILMTFGPPWLAPYGSHMHFFCRVPWVNLLFSEGTVMGVRGRFRDDGLSTYREAGLNRMTVRKFERIVSESGLGLEYKSYECVKNLALLGKIPLLRELFVNHISCVLAA